MRTAPLFFSVRFVCLSRTAGHGLQPCQRPKPLAVRFVFTPAVPLEFLLKKQPEGCVRAVPRPERRPSARTASVRTRPRGHLSERLLISMSKEVDAKTARHVSAPTHACLSARTERRTFSSGYGALFDSAGAKRRPGRKWLDFCAFWLEKTGSVLAARGERRSREGRGQLASINLAKSGAPFGLLGR